VERAGAIRAERGIPPVTIAGNPRVGLCGEPAEAGDKKKPSKKIPTGEKQPDARPGVGAAPDATVRVNGLHPAHGDVAVDLWEALLSRWIV